MSYRYDCSYPFMDIARRHGADYGDVLTYADLCDTQITLMRDRAGYGMMLLLGLEYQDVTPHHVRAARALPDLVKGEVAAMCALPVAERGGRTNVCDVCGLEVRSSVGRDWRATCPTPHVPRIPDKCLLVELEATGLPRIHQY